MLTQMEKRKSLLLSSDAFSPNNAILWKHETDLVNHYCIYLLNASYEDMIHKTFKQKSGRYSVVYYKNETQESLRSIALQYRKKDNLLQLSTASITMNYSGVYTKEEIQFGNWMVISNPDVVLQFHHEQILLFYMKQLAELSSIKQLKKQQQQLSRLGKSDVNADKKAKAIKYFLEILDNGDAAGFLDILYSNNSTIYQEMVKPRPKMYKFLFFKFDFTAPSADKTETYKLLLELKNNEALKKLKAELDRQEKKLAQDNGQDYHYKNS